MPDEKIRQKSDKKAENNSIGKPKLLVLVIITITFLKTISKCLIKDQISTFSENLLTETKKNQKILKSYEDLYNLVITSSFSVTERQKLLEDTEFVKSFTNLQNVTETNILLSNIFLHEFSSDAARKENKSKARSSKKVQIINRSKANNENFEIPSDCVYYLII